MSRGVLSAVCVSLVGAVAVDLLLRVPGDLAPLPALLLLSGLAQGGLALAAAAELSGGRWLGRGRELLLGLHPLLVIYPLYFLVFSRDLTGYPWTSHPTAWLQPSFFVARGAAVLLAAFLLGSAYARASRIGSRWSGPLAVLYLLSFTLCQSLAAYDWTMTLEAPWISTMLGPLFLVEALFGGIALLAVGASLRALRSPHEDRGPLRDAATLLFGFALFWAGLWFGQFLTIWYGNIPEEAAYLARRIHHPTVSTLFWLPLLGLFVLPFLALMPRRAKTEPLLVIPTSLLVLASVLIQKLAYLLPPPSSLPPLPTALLLILLGLPVLVLLAMESRSPQS